MKLLIIFTTQSIITPMRSPFLGWECAMLFFILHPSVSKKNATPLLSQYTNELFTQQPLPSPYKINKTMTHYIYLMLSNSFFCFFSPDALFFP